MLKNQLLEMFPIGDPLGRCILFDPISAVMGGVGVVGNLIGGAMQSSAASKAAQVQQQAAQQAGQQVTQAAQNVNPGILSAGTAAGQGATSAAGTAATGAAGAASTAGAGVTSAAGGANSILDPYSQAGQSAAAQLQAGTAAGGQFNAQPTLSQLQMDPGYAFREQQAEQTMNRSAAARGGAISGTALKDLTNYSQGAASQEYQNAFNRFQTNRQNNFQDLSGIAGQGLSAGNTQGQNLIGAAQYGGNTGIQANEFGGQLDTNAAQYAGNANINATNAAANNTLGAASQSANYLTQGANAQAAGIVGSANAWGGALSGGANAIGAAGSLYQQGQQNKALMNLLRNPAAGGGVSDGGIGVGPAIGAGSEDEG